MKLSSVDYYLDWPVSIKLKNLREFIISNLEKEGDLIRWSIVDIQNSIDSFGTKKLRMEQIYQVVVVQEFAQIVHL